MALEGRADDRAEWRRAECDLLLDEEHADETRLCFQLLDTPGRRRFAELLVPFYRTCGALVLVFDVGSAASRRDAATWLERARKYRLHASRQAPASTVVLAHVLDERAEREARTWRRPLLPYLETHAKDTGANSGWRKTLRTSAAPTWGTRSSRRTPRRLACGGASPPRRAAAASSARSGRQRRDAPRQLRRGAQTPADLHQSGLHYRTADVFLRVTWSHSTTCVYSYLELDPPRCRRGAPSGRR